jgi:hypothetical protein
MCRIDSQNNPTPNFTVCIIFFVHTELVTPACVVHGFLAMQIYYYYYYYYYYYVMNFIT